MNYRHSYHAGNFADVIKHWVMCLLLEKLCEKPAPFAVLDTHAGSGIYDLGGIEAEKTGEYKNGIARLLAQPTPHAAFARYLEIVASHAPLYPGSPRIARHFLRTDDRLVLCELHPEACAQLKQHFRHDPQTHIHEKDGYLGLKAFLPFKEKRGLVIIDPPFESADEFARLGNALIAAHQHFSHGVYMVWYPLKDRQKVERFYADMSLLPKTLAVECVIDSTANLPGCGLLFINPPWKLDETLQAHLPALLGMLGTTEKDAVTLRWLQT
jgi:23S rRNA (adenine2030-N6)-methyltransferase